MKAVAMANASPRLWSIVSLGAALLMGSCASADVRQFREGVDLSAKGHISEAYMGALDTNPRFVEVRLNLGALLYKQARYTQAEREFRLVLAQDPENVVARENLATTLEAGGEYEARGTHKSIIDCRSFMEDRYAE